MNYYPDIVIYHDKCMDGFTAAWAIWKRWPDADFVARNYGMEPDIECRGKHVLIVDFSFPEEMLRGLVDHAGAVSVTILDHHKTAAADLEPFRRFRDKPERFKPAVIAGMIDDLTRKGFPPINALFDMERSGAGMAWDFANHDAELRLERPGLVNLVEDRDLWRFELGDGSKYLHLALTAGPTTFARWDQADGDLDGFIARGEAIAAWRDQLVEEIAGRAHFRWIGGHRGIVVDCPYGLASDACHSLLDKFEDAEFAAAIIRSDESVSYSLRSRDDRADVSAIAKKWGGGGHRNAAGFKVPA